MASRLFDLMGLVVGVAMVTTIVAHPASASILTAAGNSFSAVLRAAQGN